MIYKRTARKVALGIIMVAVWILAGFYVRAGQLIPSRALMACALGLLWLLLDA